MMCNICVDIHIHVHLHIHCFRLNANCFSICIYIYIYIFMGSAYVADVFFCVLVSMIHVIWNGA